MRAYQKERFLNAVCYFAQEHSRRTGKTAFQTYIYKYLALFDFAILESEGKPALDIEYKAMPKGPVPIDLYSKKEATSHYEFLKVKGENGEVRYVINPITEPNLDYFSEEEIQVMNEILDEFASPGKTTDDLIEATHDRILAWKKAWNENGRRGSAPMEYIDTFSDGRSPESAARYSIHEEFERHGRRRSSCLGAI